MILISRIAGRDTRWEIERAPLRVTEEVEDRGRFDASPNAVGGVPGRRGGDGANVFDLVYLGGTFGGLPSNQGRQYL